MLLKIKSGWGSFASSLFLYEKENIEIVLAGVQLKKKCIDFRAMSDKILTRKSKRTDFQEDYK